MSSMTLGPKSGSLLVYVVDSEASIERIVVALAASRDRVSNLDYVVLEDTNLSSLGITVLSTTGQTPDMVANSLHYDLGHLTVDKLVGLAKIISNGRHKRIKYYQSNATGGGKCWNPRQNNDQGHHVRGSAVAGSSRKDRW